MCLITSLIIFAANVMMALPIHAQVIANPESGTADAGTSSKAIVNVATNDTINGAQAVLGASGNATVSKSTTWPTGVLLQAASGAITTTATTAVGVYNVAYNLCDLSSPPVCNSTTDTVTVAPPPTLVPVADSGTTDSGLASRPIPNVAVNDTIGGQPAILVNPGRNAAVKQGAGWPPGIALNTGTGTVTTTAAVPAGIYSIPYSLCDLNNPSLCVSETDTVTVINSTITANPDSGTAIAGVATRVVNNIAVNDTVNGAPATLGPGGNATVAQSTTSPWPAGIALTPSTGAVKTTTTQLPGVYSLSYTLCDKNGPPAGCNTGTVTVTITTAIVALPIAGSAIVGTSGTPIGDVAIPDTVNNAPVTFGASGNATVTQGASWPDGFSLDPTTGAITSAPTVPIGTYSLPFTLCDRNAPPDCSVPPGIATVAITAPYSEVQVTATAMGDVEFDWGRDGVTCASCNFGDGNNRANWTDRSGNVWIAHLDPTTGTFPNPSVNDELADTTAYFWDTWGNGPEWAFSTQNGQVVSQLVYSRWQPGQPAQPQPKAGYAGAAFTTQTAYNSGGSANWTPKFFPGAIVSGSMNSNLPEASQCNSDTQALAIYKNFGSPLHVYTEPVTSVVGTAPAIIPYPSGVVSNGIGERFVPCTHQLLYQASAPYGTTGQTVQQVFWYDIDTGVTEQLTADPVNKYAGFMFQAPDFNDNYIFFTLSDHQSIKVYEQQGSNQDGSPIFQLVNTIFSPDPNEPYLNSPEPFINCTPVCTTYAFVTLAASNTQNGIKDPNGLAVIALSPNTPLFNILVPADATPTRQRLDPEYFITPQGPYLYYNRIVPFQQGVSQYLNTGEWFINMQLGVPTGNCVGSSAEGGLLNAC
jgi:hypothetical protein